ncbi:hypothetical protein [Segetibacter koreensis]|uniref:hypothetical protein n=1 Tax=Segetibacter koreensis TaxID=398037 RepID=UPI000374E654|nr:hypothetical protein [Segetibacter koreensis]
MARMFATDFIYKGTAYEAKVIISGIDNDKTIVIQVPESLHKIVPEGRLVVNLETRKSESGMSKDPALVESIMAAVEKHEEAEPPLGVGNVWS